MSRKERSETQRRDKQLEALSAVFQMPIEKAHPDHYPDEFILPDSIRDLVKPAMAQTYEDGLEYAVDFEHRNAVWTPGRVRQGTGMEEVKVKGEAMLMAKVKSSRKEILRSALRGNPTFSFHTHPPISDEVVSASLAHWNQELPEDETERERATRAIKHYLGFLHAFPSVPDVKDALMRVAFGLVASAVFSPYGATLLVSNIEDPQVLLSPGRALDLRSSKGRVSSFQEVLTKEDRGKRDDYGRLMILKMLSAHTAPEMSVYFSSGYTQPKFVRIHPDSTPSVFYKDGVVPNKSI